MATRTLFRFLFDRQSTRYIIRITYMGVLSFTQPKHFMTLMTGEHLTNTAFILGGQEPVTVDRWAGHEEFFLLGLRIWYPMLDLLG